MAARKRPIQKKRTAQEQKEDLESLFVFGYQCKVFKDDEKADYIERGKHLIPWMGDNSLMIDRYDGRGYLHDLQPYDADLNGHKTTELTGEELAVEAACEEERYLELNADYMERVLYEEEELKRLHEALGEDSYGAVGFSYDQGVGQQNDQDNSDSEKDEEFIPPSDFHVPDGIKLPDTVKMNAIVVKTAKCISEHGTQMEIIIKTKQADNPQFHFLEYDSELYPYYRHLLQVFKSGRYNPSSMLKPRRSRQESMTEEDEHYLHPSLVKTSSSSNLSTQDILSIISHRLPVSQISDTPYARLVEKMKQSGCRSPLNCTQPKSQAAPVGGGVAPLEPPPMPPFVVMADAEPQKKHGRLPPVPGVEPVILPPRSQPPPETTPPQHEYTPPHSSYTEDDDRPPIEPPPPDLQPIIDKMAMYVAKNGPEFEIVVKSKKDKRFDFLHSWHKHFPYYYNKKILHLQELKGAASSSGDDDDSNSNDRGQLKSISFSIRNKEMDAAVSLSGRAALLGYDSSSEDGSSGEKDEDGDEDNACEGTVVIPEHVTITKDKIPPSTEKQEKRRVEQRLRDKLAAAARDKLAHAAKEKQLQAERKRKAAMFICMLKGGTAAAQPNSELQPLGSTLPTSASAPTMSLEGNPSSTRSDDPPTGTPPNYRHSPDLCSRFPRRSRSPISHHRSRHKRHWSPPKRRSRSPVKRARGKTPPSAYSVVRRSLSKSPRRRQKSQSRSPHRPRRPRPATPSLNNASSPSMYKSKSKGKKRSRSRSKSKRSRSKSKSRQRSMSRRQSRSKSKIRSASKAKESSLSRTSPSREKSRKYRSRSRSHTKLKRSRKSPSRSKKHKRLGSRSPSRRKRSHSRLPSRHKSKKHSKSKKKSPSKHKSKSRSKKSPSKSKRSSRSRSKKRSSSPSPVPSPSTSMSKQPSRSRSKSVDGALDSKTESKRSPSMSKAPSVDNELHSEDGNQDMKKAESEPVESLATSTNDDPPAPMEHKEALSREATDDDASNDSDVIITGEETAPLRDPVATSSTLRGVDSPLGVGKQVSEDLLMKVRAMLKASRQIDTT